MDTTQTTTHIGLCAGYGGIEIGLHRVIRNLRTVALCEIEAFACANLVAKMEAGLMDCAPIWANLKTFPFAEFHGRVDVLTGGYPCQPFSAAGKRLGTADPRHLWPFIADGIRAMRPRMCFFENVEGHITLGLREVVGELEEIGYQTTWGIFSAREVGAPHQRKRVFILAYDKSQRVQGHGSDWIEESRSHVGQAIPMCGGKRCELADTSDGTDTASGHAETNRLPSEYREAVCSGEFGGADADAWPSRPGQPQYGWEPPRVVGDTIYNDGVNVSRAECAQAEQSITSNSSCVGNTQHDGSHQRGSQAGGAESSGEQGWVQEPAGGSASMGDAETRRRGESGDETSEGQGHRSARSSRSDEELSEVEPALGRDFDGFADWLDDAELFVTCDNRTDELRLLGNGVVPATA